MGNENGLCTSNKIGYRGKSVISWADFITLVNINDYNISSIIINTNIVIINKYGSPQNYRFKYGHRNLLYGRRNGEKIK